MTVNNKTVFHDPIINHLMKICAFCGESFELKTRSFLNPGHPNNPNRKITVISLSAGTLPCRLNVQYSRVYGIFITTELEALSVDEYFNSKISTGHGGICSRRATQGS